MLIVMILICLLLGVVLVIFIGGVDMLVVIVLLNFYFGLVGLVIGFVLGNNGFIIIGLLVGVFGLILIIIMCKVMNCLLINVLFGGFMVVKVGISCDENDVFYDGKVKIISVDEVVMLFDFVSCVVFVFGYGLVVV